MLKMPQNANHRAHCEHAVAAVQWMALAGSVIHRTAIGKYL